MSVFQDQQESELNSIKENNSITLNLENREHIHDQVHDINRDNQQNFHEDHNSTNNEYQSISKDQEKQDSISFDVISSSQHAEIAKHEAEQIQPQSNLNHKNLAKDEEKSEVLIEEVNLKNENKASENTETKKESETEAKIDAGSNESGSTETKIEDDLPTRILKATAVKNSAKTFVGSGQYDNAIQIYKNAFYTLKLGAQDHNDPNFKKAIALQNDLFNNLSLCASNLQRYQESIVYAGRVLIIDKENVKALFRLAAGYKNLGDHMNAYTEIQKCKEAFKKQNPGVGLDPKIHELYLSLKETCKKTLQEQEQKEREIYSKMMGNSKQKEKDQDNQGEKRIEKTSNDKKSFLAKTVLYGLCVGNSIALGVIAQKVIKQGTPQGVKSLIPAFIATIGAILCGTYAKNNSKNSLFGIGFATAAAAFMIPKSK